MAKVTISNIWHLPLHLVKKETTPGSKEANEDLNATAVVRVKAPLSVTRRSHIHLVVVIDVGCTTVWKEAPLQANKLSGLDLLKKALKFIMRQLHDGDRLTIVFKNMKFEISEATLTDDEKKVGQFLATADNTMFRSGLAEAGKIFDEEGVDTKHLRFIVLLSDGLGKSNFKWNDDKNLDDKQAALRGLLVKYPVHTFGLGKGHDPTALLFIADESKGTYSSITENVSSMLIEALAVCLVGLMSIVAVDTVINIKAMEGAEGSTTTITGIEGDGSLRPKEVDKTSHDIPLGILYAGEVKDLVVHFRIKIGYFKQGSSDYAPLSAEGHYKAIPGGQSKCIERRMPAFSVYARKTLKPQNERPLLPFPVVRQQKVRNKVVCLVASLQKDYKELKKKAGNSGDKEGGKLAVETMAGNTLMEKWTDFKKSDKSWKNAQEIGLDLERIENDIEEMVRGLKRGLGMGCVFSWVLSNQMQRAATTGLPATSFRTSAMKKMVRQARIKLDEEASSSASRNTDPPAVPPGEVMCLCKRLELLSTIDPEILRALGSQVSQGQ